MAGTTYNWFGGSGLATVPSNWTPSGPPGSGDTAIVTSGTVLNSPNTQVTNDTIYLGSATLNFLGSSAVTYFSPTLDNNTLISSAVPGAASAEASVLNSGGVFINQGEILADGPSGSTFTLNISPTGTGSAFVPGYFTNYGLVEVDAGNAMTIAIGSGSELFNVGGILVNGGSLFINASPSALAGGYAPVFGVMAIEGGGTVETNAGYASTVSGQTAMYVFADATKGNTLKIDNIGSFGGLILAFGQNDTIDLGTSLAVAQLVYSSTTSILNLENAGGTILSSLAFASGNFNSGTFALTGTTAGSFNINVGTNGNTVLTTAVQNHTYDNASGVWQTGSAWVNGVPGSSDTAIIGIGASSPFTLTTGSTAVSVGELTLASNDATLQITSKTTTGPYTITDLGGLLEVTSSNTLTAPALRMTSGTVELDPTALLALTGHTNLANVGAINGTISISNGNTTALRVYGGSLLVNGGTINAAPSGSGGGGNIYIGYDGDGTPATMTVQNSGANAAVVTDTYTEVSSDATSFGVLTLNGNVTWTDEIDPHDSVTSTGRMIVGINNVAANTGTLTPPAFTNAATLLVENGASLTDPSSAQIAATADSAGTATIETGGIWSIGTGGLSVGFMGSGVLSILSAGTVTVGSSGIGVANSLATANGTITVQGDSSLLSTAGGISVGKLGQGVLQILNGGTVQVTGSGITAATTAGSTGSISISGTDAGSGASALLAFGTAAGGLTIGGAGNGTLAVGSGGTIQMNGTGGISAGQSLSATGLITVSGPGALITEGTTASGITIGQAGTGTLQVLNGATVVVNGKNLVVGSVSGDSGNVSVSGPGSAIKTLGTTGINVGSPGSGTLTIGSGGFVSTPGGVIIAAGNTVSSSGTVIVNTGGTLSDGGPLTVGSNGSGTLSVQGGLVQSTGTNGIAVGGFSARASGLLILNGGTVTDPGSFTVGNTNAFGTLELEAGLLSTTGSFFPSINSTGSGQAVAIVSGGTWSTNGLTVGNNGTGSLDINSTGLVLSTGTSGIGIGGNNGATGILTVENNGTLNSSGGLIVASPISGSSQGTVTVGDGGTVTVGGLSVGGGGIVTVGGTANAAVLNSSGINIGQSGTGALLTIGSHGAVTDTNSVAQINIGSGGTSAASGAVTVNSGGLLSSTTAGIGIGTGFAGSTGTLTVNGGTVTSGGGFTIGQAGTGTLTINGGQVSNSGSNSFSINGGGVFINAGSLTDTGNFFVANISSAVGTLLVNTSAVAGISGSLTVGSAGLIDMTGGALSASGLTQAGGTIAGFGTMTASLNNTGIVTANGGRLIVTGSIAGTGAINIDGGATMEVDSGLGFGQAVTFVSSASPAALQLNLLTSTTQSFGLTDWQNGDALVIGSGLSVTGAQWLGNGTLAVNTSGPTYDFTNVTLAAGTTPIFATGSNFVELVSCFATGTRITTETGEVAVEDLREGDRLELLVGAAREIIWIGRRQISCARHPRPHQVWPVRILAGAFGPARPCRDLWLSPDHAVYINEVLIPVKYLLNGTTITQVPVGSVTYHHIELSQHSVLLADGVPTESYLDTGDRSTFSSGRGVTPLYPDFSSLTWEAMGCAPLVVAGPELMAVRRLVNERARVRATQGVDAAA